MEGDRAVAAGDGVADTAELREGRLEQLDVLPVEEIHPDSMQSATYSFSRPASTGDATGMSGLPATSDPTHTRAVASSSSNSVAIRPLRQSTKAEKPHQKEEQDEAREGEGDEPRPAQETPAAVAALLRRPADARPALAAELLPPHPHARTGSAVPRRGGQSLHRLTHNQRSLLPCSPEPSRRDVSSGLAAERPPRHVRLKHVERRVNGERLPQEPAARLRSPRA